MVNKYSVLMSVYWKETPENLKNSIQSMLEQTLPPNEIVLVKDGPLTKELETVIEEFINVYKFVKTVPIAENVGLGKALNAGLKACINEFVARMDTDDIAMPDRCAKQIKCLSENSNLSVIGSAVAEFIGDPSNIVAFKHVKEYHADIRRQIKFRNPINHPTVMFRKSHVLEAGNYEEWFLNEDYYLWIRMINKGHIFRNINEPLVKMQITDDTYLRRGGWKYFLTQKRLFDYMLSIRLINYFEYIYNNLIRFGTRIIIPNKIRKFVYLNFLRKKGTFYDKQADSLRLDGTR